MDIAGKTAFVTGGASGLGAATARTLAASGATVDGASDEDTVVMNAANASLQLMTNQALQRDFGRTASGDQGLEARAIVFGVDDLNATKTYMSANRIDCEKFRGRLIVPPAPGQGAILAFEANE